jgi:hypothetical protein
VLQVKSAKDERLCDAVEISTGEGDAGQGICLRLKFETIQYLAPKFGWQVHGGGTGISHGSER